MGLRWLPTMAHPSQYSGLESKFCCLASGLCLISLFFSVRMVIACNLNLIGLLGALSNQAWT